jgi:predicted enzyme related to lactoylglutathione lyase
MNFRRMPLYATLLTLLACGSAHDVAATPPPAAPAPPAISSAQVSSIAVAPQYDTTHVYVAPEDVDKFVSSFVATFGGQSTKQVVVQVTPTPSSTSSQLIQTPVGTVSLFGFKTPIPTPFGAERTGYLVTDLDAAITSARAAGADVIVEPFPDPIGRDAVVQWPGGVNMQLYWHTKKPAYAAYQNVPENRVYVSKDRVDAFVQSFVRFSNGSVTSDTRSAPGAEIGRPNDTYRRVRVESAFGKLVAIVTDGHLPYPYGHELTGYEVADLTGTLTKARAAAVEVLVEPVAGDDRQSSMVRFPGGYVAEIHSTSAKAH